MGPVNYLSGFRGTDLVILITSTMSAYESGAATFFWLARSFGLFLSMLNELKKALSVMDLISYGSIALMKYVPYLKLILEEYTAILSLLALTISWDQLQSTCKKSSWDCGVFASCLTLSTSSFWLGIEFMILRT